MMERPLSGRTRGMLTTRGQQESLDVFYWVSNFSDSFYLPVQIGCIVLQHDPQCSRECVAPPRPGLTQRQAQLLLCCLVSRPWSLAESHHTHANGETARELCPGSACECQDACRRRCNEARDIHRALLLLDSSRLGSTHTLTHACRTCLLQRAALNSELRLRHAAVDMCELHRYVWLQSTFSSAVGEEELWRKLKGLEEG